MSEPLGTSTAITAPQPTPPGGQCGVCGYPVHSGAGFICSECGADLRQAGIVTAGQRRAGRSKNLLRMLLFAFIWAIVCATVSALFLNLVAVHFWPEDLSSHTTYHLTPLAGHYEDITVVKDVHGLLFGAYSADEPLKDHPKRWTYDLIATLHGPQGSTTLRVDVMHDLAWRRTGGTTGEKIGDGPLNRPAVVEWLSAAGRDTTDIWTQHEVDELLFVFHRVGRSIDEGLTFNEATADAVGKAVNDWYGIPAFNGQGNGNSPGAPTGPPEQGYWVIAAGLLWAGGLGLFLLRQRGAAAAPTKSPTRPKAPPPQDDATTSAKGDGDVAHRLLSILFSDVKDYTSRSAGQSRVGVLDIVHRHRSRVFPIVKKHGGRVVKQMGDGILATFESATNAVLAGLEIQSSTPDRADEPLLLRIAVSTGEVVVEADDVFGPAVNVAARVQQLAEPGDVLITETTNAVLNDREVKRLEVGVFELKGVPQPVKVFRAVRAGDG